MGRNIRRESAKQYRIKQSKIILSQLSDDVDVSEKIEAIHPWVTLTGSPLGHNYATLVNFIHSLRNPEGIEVVKRAIIPYIKNDTRYTLTRRYRYFIQKTPY